MHELPNPPYRIYTIRYPPPSRQEVYCLHESNSVLLCRNADTAFRRDVNCDSSRKRNQNCRASTFADTCRICENLYTKNKVQFSSIREQPKIRRLSFWESKALEANIEEHFTHPSPQKNPSAKPRPGIKVYIKWWIYIIYYTKQRSKCKFLQNASNTNARPYAHTSRKFVTNEQQVRCGLLASQRVRCSVTEASQPRVDTLDATRIDSNGSLKRNSTEVQSHPEVIK